MFPGLGHHALIRGHDHHHQIHADDAGGHIADEFFMAGDVDDPAPCAVIQIKPGKTEIDGYAAPLLLREAVSVAAGKRAYDRGLAVIYMAGSAYDNVFHDTPPVLP